MNQINRFCKMKGHYESPIHHICSLLECNQPTRWCCAECIVQEVHSHQKPDKSHVMTIKELLLKLKGESEKYKENLEGHNTIQLLITLQKILKECLGLEHSIIDYRNSIESQIQNISQSQSKFKSFQNKLVINKFEVLDDIKINELLKVNLKQVNQNLQLLPLDNIKQQLYSIENILKDFQENKNDYTNPINDLKDRKYITLQIDQNNTYYYGSQISKNEKYLAYGDDNVLKIYELKQKNIIKEIKQDNHIYVCQFTQDQSQLYIGLKGGYTLGYDVQDDFKEIYQQQIHSDDIYNLMTIQNEYLITCSDDKSIIKTDIKSKQQIFRLTGHTGYVFAIYYNDKDEMIVNGQQDKSIKLWNCRNQTIVIKQKYQHNNEIQTQLINNNLNILSLDLDGNLYKWKIDLTNKDLIKPQQLKDCTKIFNLNKVNWDQNLLLICNNYVKILNKQGQTINTIEHGYKDGQLYPCRQLDNLKFILIITLTKIMLAIAQK